MTTAEVQIVHIEELMTLDELDQFKYTERWGTAKDAVRRGAAFLDREIPDWREKVNVQDLELASSCSCVLGQVFHKEARKGSVADDGFDFAYTKYNMQITPSDLAQSDGWTLYDASSFFGFDFSDTYGYAELQQAWTEELA